MNRKLYYILKPVIPRRLQILARQLLAQKKLDACSGIWPIDPGAGTKPSGWPGWPEHKRFALILTHDVDTAGGHERCLKLMRLEKRMGFRSSFNFVARRYQVSEKTRKTLSNEGFEVGVHGLYHDGKLYNSFDTFVSRASAINTYLKDWGAVGFRSPAMHHNLEWLHYLEVEYDASTFDTDPFEPQADGVNTVFPFFVPSPLSGGGYVELPYTLPQDFTLFIILKEKSIRIWKQKLDWIVEKEGMALINVHPDYMKFEEGKLGAEEYPVGYYREFLEYISNKYKNQYWNPLPKQVSQFVHKNIMESLYTS